MLKKHNDSLITEVLDFFLIFRNKHEKRHNAASPIRPFFTNYSNEAL